MTRPSFGDLALRETLALPNGAATTLGAAIDVGCGTPDDFPVNAEFKIEAPALSTGDHGNGATLTFSLVTDDVDTFNSSALVVLLPSVLVQTGAGGAGAAAASWQGRAPIGGVRKYIGLKAVKSGAGDISDQTATLSMLF
jgi:hypothetical protein